MWRALIWPLVALSGGLSALSWLLRYPFPALIDERDRKRVRNCFGILDPKLDGEWARYLKRWWSPHDLNNLGSEWCELDPQRAFKACAMVALFWMVLGLVF